jgi:cell shape-determining protein MreC
MSTSSPNTDGQSVGQVFEQFKSYIDTRNGIRNLENSLQPANHDQTETNDIQASTRKLQREADALTFKYKANAKQFIYNAEVNDLVIYMVNILRKKIL